MLLPDDFRVEIEAFCNGNISMLHDLESHKGRSCKSQVMMMSLLSTVAQSQPFLGLYYTPTISAKVPADLVLSF